MSISENGYPNAIAWQWFHPSNRARLANPAVQEVMLVRDRP
jgi:hypothetical protein